MFLPAKKSRRFADGKPDGRPLPLVPSPLRPLLVSVVLLVLLAGCSARPAVEAVVEANDIRIATFNVAMGMDEPGALARALQRNDEPRLRQLAAVLQRVRPDVVLLNEFDYDPSVDAARLLNDNYLSAGQFGESPIDYPHAFRAPVNTGVPSGLDLDGDGTVGGPGDAWGFGRFPGQYGMLVLSRFPIDAAASRTFQRFRWDALPAARRPLAANGDSWYPESVWERLRLSSKSHWDVVIEVADTPLHLLAFHPTPPVFDGPEDRNGLRNFDEIRFWADFIENPAAPYLVDDAGKPGGLPAGARFVVAGDFNADPLDGNSVAGAVEQLLGHPLTDAGCVPRSTGGRVAAQAQGGVNLRHRGDPAADTADFEDTRAGNLRTDYVLPSRALAVNGCGVFWPAPGEPGADWVGISDHRLVWVDVSR